MGNVRPKPTSEPKTRPLAALERNTESVTAFLAMQSRETAAMGAVVARISAKTIPDLSTKPGRQRYVRRIRRFRKKLDRYIERTSPAKLWTIVMLVTCVEAYLQDVLSAAACADRKLLSKSGRLHGGPALWISRLGRKGVQAYPHDLVARMEVFWGIRHVAVHAAGVATAEFVTRHPKAVAVVGKRLQVGNRDLLMFLKAIGDFVNPTDAFFLGRYPALKA